MLGEPELTPIVAGCLACLAALAIPMPDAWWWCLLALNVGNACGVLIAVIRIRAEGSRHGR